MTSETFFRVLSQNVEGAAVLTLSGELDLSNVATLEVYACKAVEGRGGIIFDMHDLRYLDSSGIRALLGFERSLSRENRRIALVGPSPLVRRVLGVLSLEEVMPVFGTVDEALSYVRARESCE
jgi:anti-sigma B factor antagonist